MKKAIVAIVGILIIVGIIYFNRYTTVRTFDIDGYLFTSENITRNLVNGHDVSKKNVDYSKVKYDDSLYKGKGKYYIGDRKKVTVNLDYPVVSSDSDTLLILNDNSKLVDDEYRKTNAYANSFLSDNKLFNESDYERADNINYIFLELNNSIFANLSVLSITNGNKEYVIPINSFIMFYDTGLRYYYISNGKYIYNEIKGLSKETIVKFNDDECDYLELLERLGLYALEEEIPEIDIAPIIVEEEKKSTGDNKVNELDEIKYVKPEVNFSGAKANTYSFSGQLNINDPTSQIVKYPTFEFWNGKTLYVRKTFINAGTIEVKGLYPDTEYEVIGTFNFKNEKGQEVKSEFTRFKIKTKDMSDLEHVKINVNDIEVTYNSAKFSNVKLDNQENDEVLKGIKKIILIVDNNNFQLGNGVISKLLKLEYIDYETAKSLTSNTKYNALFEAYDVAGNKLIVDGDEYSFKTTKQAPTGNLTIVSREINKANVKFNINNKDDINIKNMYYELYDINKELIRKVGIDELEAIIDNLDANEVYNIKMYGSYDLEDGKGILKDQLIIDGKFTTEPISTLGYVKLNFSDVSATTDSITYTISLSDEVNDRLKALLSSMEFRLKDSVTNEVVDYVKISEDDFLAILNGDGVTFTSSNLESNHAYYFDLVSYVQLGRKKYDIKTICNINNVKTLKKDAEVLIVNKFITESMIDFDVAVSDVDGAIESTRVLFDVRDVRGVLIYYDELEINSDYKHITLNKLNKNEYYTFTFKVEEYNIGHDNTTFESDYELYECKMYTEEGLYGTVAIETLLKQITSKNLFDLRNNGRWKSAGSMGVPLRKIDTDANTVSLAAKNGYRTYSYYLPEYKGKKVAVSFKIKFLDDNSSPVYLCYSGSDNCKHIQINGIKKGEWLSYSKVITIDKSSPYVSFTILETAGENDVTTIVLKDLQIEAGDKVTSYEPYSEKDNYMGTFVTNLVDKNKEIPKEKFYYYLRFYKDNKLVDTVEFDFNDQYQVIDEIYKHEIVPKKNYNIKLSIKKKIATSSIEEDDDIDEDGYRFYDLATLSFTSDDEIRTIRTYEELISLHVSGTYLVAEDINYRDRSGSVGIEFNGNIDFQGHRVDMDTKLANGTSNSIARIFWKIGRRGVVKNIDVHYYFEGQARSEINGIAYYNYGLIENIMVTVEQDNNAGNTIVSLIARENVGQIKNFVIYLKDSVTISQNCGLVAITNYGTVMNGYLYGKSINGTPLNGSLDNKYIGGVVRYAASNSYIANIYSLIDIDLFDGASAVAHQYEVGNILAPSSRSIVRNVYSYSNSKNRNLSKDMNIYSGTMNVSNVYYASDDTYGGNYSNRISPNALRNISFQEILNADNAFEVEEFVKYGYYPHLKWPEVMPNQEYILLPNEDDGKVDYLSVENKVEFDDETVEATLIFQNPGYDTITKLEFSDGLHCDILSQENASNKSSLRVKFSSPASYYSKYSLIRVSHRDSAGFGHTRDYANKERIVEIDMYKNISTIEELKGINKKTKENFKLQADLDFNNIAFNIPTFSGKLDGNEHTISNIRETDCNFINTLSGGTLKNLFVKNYFKNGNKANGGFIGKASGNANIDNVHLTGVSVTDSVTYVGGFIGQTDGALISNSSITNVHIYEKDKNNVTFEGRYGGFIGENNNTVVQNCFAQDVNIEITTALSTFGIGGFVGRNASGYIQDSYVVGYINTNQQEVGGIAGYNNAYIERCISNVDIYTQQDSLGEIAGYSTNEAISGTLAIGGIYTGKTAINQNRSIGNRSSGVGTYAWDNQLINGLRQNSSSGDILVTSEELKSDITYNLFIGDQFDLSRLSNEKGHNLMPKLKYLSSDKLLPNQVDNEFYFNDFRVSYTEAMPAMNSAVIQIIINNPQNYEIVDLAIDGLDIKSVNRNFTGDGETSYEVSVVPNKYYDSYLINKITYLKDGKEYSFNPSSKINLTFYKDISTFEDWQKISTDVYENYRLTGDIDFTGKTNVKTRVLINKLKGIDGGHTIKNITIDTVGAGGHVGLIDTLACSIEDVTFDNINIRVTGNKTYTGIIRFLNGTMKNVNFTNINISSASAYTAVVAFNQAPDIRNVRLDNVTIKGTSYVGGFIARSRYFDISHITGTHLRITGSSERVGGLIAFHDNATSPTIFNLSVDDAIVSGTNYVGGIFGLGGGNYLKANDVHITGTSFVGGMAGQAYFTYVNSGIITNSEITGKGSDIGGIFGYSNDARYFYADNIVVKGTRENAANNVGGLFGRGNYTRYYSGIRNSIVENAGNYTGGIVGKLESAGLQTSYIYNTSVVGAKYVGGLAGYSTGNSTVYYCISDATVRATGDYAGGIYGKLNNLNTTSAANIVRAYRNILAGSRISSEGSHAGAVASNTDNYPFKGHFYDNFISTSIISNGGQLYNLFIGNDVDDFINSSLLGKIGVYENSTYNGEKIFDIKDKLPENVTLYSAEDMRVEKTFKNVVVDTYNFSKVTSGKYPYLSYQWSNFGLQYYDLPTGEELLGSSRSYGNLPDVTVYASDVDKINVEFSKIDRNVSFKINNNTYSLEKQTYTFYYDFKEDFAIDIFDSVKSKTVNLKAEDVRNSSSVSGNNYYYIDGNDITTSDGTTSVNKMANNKKDYKVLALANEDIMKESKTPVNLYENKVLLSNKNIYDADTKVIRENNFENLTLAEDTSLYSFSYGDNEIDTYYNYSIVNGEVISKQVFVSDDKLEILDSTLDSVKDSNLIGQYNGKSYVIYLGTDGRLHSLKDNIKTPRRFKNNNIKSISTDMYKDSDIVFVLYNNGDYIVFNYLTGKVICEEMKSNNDLVSYFTSYFTNTRVGNTKEKEYKSTNDLIDKINKKSPDEVLGNEKGDTKIKVAENYTTVYNPVTEKYEIYKLPSGDNIVNDISSGTEEKLDVVLTKSSTSNEIDNNLTLFNYYIGNSKRKQTILVSVLLIVVTIIGGISVAVLLLKRNLRKSN